MKENSEGLLLNPNIIQYLAIAGSVIIFIFIIQMIRVKRLKEQYSLLWVFFSLIFIVFSVWRDGLEIVSRLLGIAYPPATLFLILIMSLFIIVMQFSIVISGLSEKNKELIQEIGLIRLELEELKNSKVKKKKGNSFG